MCSAVRFEIIIRTLECLVRCGQYHQAMEVVDLCMVPKMQRYQSTKEKQKLMRYIRVGVLLYRLVQH